MAEGAPVRSERNVKTNEICGESILFWNAEITFKVKFSPLNMAGEDTKKLNVKCSK